MMRFIVAIVFLALNFYTYQFFATDEIIPQRQTWASFPDQLGPWRCAGREEMSEKSERILGVTDYLLCNFWRDDTRDSVGVYIGYHESQVRREGGGGNETVIHPPEHCLPGAGWNIIDAGVVSADIPGLPPRSGVLGSQREAKRFVIAKGDARQLVYFWYQSLGRVYAQNSQVVLTRMWDRATANRTDGALVRFTISIEHGDVARAEAAFRDLSGRIVPLLPAYVPN